MTENHLLVRLHFNPPSVDSLLFDSLRMSSVCSSKFVILVFNVCELLKYNNDQQTPNLTPDPSNTACQQHATNLNFRTVDEEKKAFKNRIALQTVECTRVVSVCALAATCYALHCYTFHYTTTTTIISRKRKRGFIWLISMNEWRWKRNIQLPLLPRW